MDGNDLRDMIKGSKIIFQASGGKKKPLKEEKVTINFAFSSVCSSKPIFPGEKLNINNICLKRPGNGYYKVNDFKNLMGRTVKRYIKSNTQVHKKDLI